MGVFGGNGKCVHIERLILRACFSLRKHTFVWDFPLGLVRVTNAGFHKNRALNEESMKIGMSMDFDMLKTIRFFLIRDKMLFRAF